MVEKACPTLPDAAADSHRGHEFGRERLTSREKVLARLARSYSTIGLG
jgi:hypothetical protein